MISAIEQVERINTSFTFISGAALNYQPNPLTRFKIECNLKSIVENGYHTQYVRGGITVMRGIKITVLMLSILVLAFSPITTPPSPSSSNANSTDKSNYNS
jgi:hypothetical protein